MTTKTNKSFTYKKRSKQKKYFEINEEKNILKLILVKLFGKTEYIHRSDKNGICLITLKLFRGKMYAIKEEYFKSPR